MTKRNLPLCQDAFTPNSVSRSSPDSALFGGRLFTRNDPFLLNPYGFENTLSMPAMRTLVGQDLVKRLVNGILSPVGFQLKRKRNPSLFAKDPQYLALVGEMEDVFRHFLFTDLPDRPRRTELVSQLIGTQVCEAFYILSALNRALGLEGDICEFGVAQGATSALLANEIRESRKSLWLFDSFEGLPAPTAKDELIDDIFNLGTMAAYEGKMACSATEVRQRLDVIDFPSDRVVVVPGFIEETSKRARLPEQVCFAYIDFDFYEPILIALELIDSRLALGGTVIVDDYEFFSSGAKTAVAEFLDGRSGRYELTVPPTFAGHFCLLRKVSE